MAGFAVIIAPGLESQALTLEFESIAGNTAGFKHFVQPATRAEGRGILAAKFDSPASIHRGIVHDEASGSWLLAAGTVVALRGDNHPERGLQALLRAYLERGAKALDDYDGHFGLVIYNGRDDSLSVLSDPMGLFSVFHGRRGGEIYIASSALAIAKQIQSPPDVLAVEHFLRAGRLDMDTTLWEGVKRMLAGRLLIIRDGRITESTYWQPTHDRAVTRLRMKDALDQYDAILSETFSRLLEREGRVWADLTGGFDSRLVATYIDKLKLPFRAYCMGPADSPDVQLAHEISRVMGWDFQHSHLPEAWEDIPGETYQNVLGSGDGGASLLRFAVTRRGHLERNGQVKTNVAGIGGENLRGYYWQIEKAAIGQTSKVNYTELLDHLIPSLVPLDAMRQDRTAAIRQRLLTFVKDLNAPYASYPNNVQIDQVEMYRDAGHGGAYLSSTTNMQRTLGPLCFKAPADYAFSLNYRWKMPRFHEFLRALLERQNRQLASLETTSGGPAYPIRLENLPRFWPMWRTLANRASAVGSKRLIGKAIEPWPQPVSQGYPLPAWRKAFHDYARSEGMLRYDTMVIGGLFDRQGFANYLERYAAGAYPRGEFLDHVISVEMAMRATGACIS